MWWRICPSDRQYLRRSERASERASEYIGTKYPSPVRASEPSEPRKLGSLSERIYRDKVWFRRSERASEARCTRSARLGSLSERIYRDKVWVRRSERASQARCTRSARSLGHSARWASEYIGTKYGSSVCCVWARGAGGPYARSAGAGASASIRCHSLQRNLRSPLLLCFQLPLNIHNLWSPRASNACALSNNPCIFLFPLPPAFTAPPSTPRAFLPPCPARSPTPTALSRHVSCSLPSLTQPPRPPRNTLGCIFSAASRRLEVFALRVPTSGPASPLRSAAPVSRTRCFRTAPNSLPTPPCASPEVTLPVDSASQPLSSLPFPSSLPTSS